MNQGKMQYWALLGISKATSKTANSVIESKFVDGSKNFQSCNWLASIYTTIPHLVKVCSRYGPLQYFLAIALIAHPLILLNELWSINRIQWILKRPQ